MEQTANHSRIGGDWERGGLGGGVGGGGGVGACPCGFSSSRCEDIARNIDGSINL